VARGLRHHDDMKNAFLGTVVLLLAACGGEDVILRPLPTATDADKSTEVTIIRPRATIAAEFPFYIVVADQPVFDLRNGEHTRFFMPAGRQVLAIRCLGGPLGNPPQTRVEHDFPALGEAFFVVEPKHDCVSVRTISAREAAADLGTTRFRAIGSVNRMAQATGEAPAIISNQAAPLAPPAPSASAGKTSHEQVAAATAAWVDAFNKRDAAAITALYDPEAVLWGTSAQRIAAGPAAISEYFKSIDAPQRSAVTASIGEQRIRVYGDTAVDTGTYTFWVTRDGKQEPVPARYSMVYRNRGGKWLIVDHHSSRVPAPVP
jgi:uncharacterized protein (TIGR02246 family)